MKRLVDCLTIILSTFYMLSAFADSSRDEIISHLQQGEKIYVSPDQLGFSEHRIFIQFNNEWFQTTALSVDEQGIYIQNLWPQENGCKDGFEPCRNCNRCIKWYYDICPHCERPA